MTASSTPGADAPVGAGAGSDAPVRRKRSAKRTFASTTLTLEALVILFATLVAYGLRVAPPGVLWLAGGGLALVLLLLSGMVGRPGGYVAGSVAQVPVAASGFVLLAAPVAGGGFGATILFVIAGIFIALWVISLRLGGRIDRERAEWDAAHPVS
jgi:Protein of unknown function (DUF4233)